MGPTLIATVDRAGDHVVVVGVLLLIAVVAGLVYGLVRLAGKKRAGRTHSHRGGERAEGPEA